MKWQSKRLRLMHGGSWSWLQQEELVMAVRSCEFSVVSSCWSKTFGARQARSKEEERKKSWESLEFWSKLWGTALETRVAAFGVSEQTDLVLCKPCQRPYPFGWEPGWVPAGSPTLFWGSSPWWAPLWGKACTVVCKGSSPARERCPWSCGLVQRPQNSHCSWKETWPPGNKTNQRRIQGKGRELHKFNFILI